jgi:hypothetical protein
MISAIFFFTQQQDGVVVARYQDVLGSNLQKPNLLRFHSTQNTFVFIDDGNIYILYIIYTSMHDLTNLGRPLLNTLG